jgi:hypothetical protein
VATSEARISCSDIVFVSRPSTIGVRRASGSCVRVKRFIIASAAGEERGAGKGVRGKGAGKGAAALVPASAHSDLGERRALQTLTVN